MSVSTDQVPRLVGVRLYALLTAIAFGAFLISLDGFIVNVALPTMAGDLAVREDVATWIITVFTMANTLFIPLSGRLSMRFGNRPVFTYGLIIFGLASFFCGISYHFTALCFFRILQGAGAGLILPVSLALIITHFPAEKRSAAVGFWSFFVMVGPAMGPMVGGWFSAHNWHHMFLINIPFILAILLLIYVILGPMAIERGQKYSDWVGTALLFTGMSALQIALNRGQIDDWFRSPFIIFLFIVTFVCLLFFVIWELFEKNGFVDIQQFKRRNFILPSICMSLSMAMLFSSFVLDSLWVFRVLGYTPAWTGLTLTPVGLFPLILYPLVGRYVNLLDLRIWLIASYLLFALTFFWVSHLNIEVSFWQIAIPRLIQGIGFPFFTIPNAILVIRGVAPYQLSSVISLFSFVRMMAVALAIPLVTTLWIHRTAFYQSRTAEQTFLLNPSFSNIVQSFEQIASSKQQAIALSNEYLLAQSTTLGLTDIYYAFGWIFLGLCIIVMFFKTSRI